MGYFWKKDVYFVLVIYKVTWGVFKLVSIFEDVVSMVSDLEFRFLVNKYWVDFLEFLFYGF